MGERTKIAWCDDTFNPWVGCEPVSDGCANCYEAAQVHRWGKDFAKRERTSASNWKKPLAWNRKPWVCDDCGFALASDPVLCRCGGQRFHRRRVFCGSMCDWLDRKANPIWRLGLLHLIWSTPNLTWLMLSKRIEDWRELVNQCWSRSSDSLQSRADFSGKLPEYEADEFRKWLQRWLEQDTPPANVWIGTTVENQKAADQRIPALLRIPAAKRFLSVEPMLGPVEVTPYIGGFTHRCKCGDSDKVRNGYHRTEFSIQPAGRGNREGGRWFCPACESECETRPAVNWVIVGGESGPKARPCNVEWIRSVVSQCKAAGVPCFVKQLGSNRHNNGLSLPSQTPRERGAWQSTAGADPSEWPVDMRVREWPKE